MPWNGAATSATRTQHISLHVVLCLIMCVTSKACFVTLTKAWLQQTGMMGSRGGSWWSSLWSPTTNFLLLDVSFVVCIEGLSEFMAIQKSGQDFGSNSFYAQTFTMHHFCRSCFFQFFQWLHLSLFSAASCLLFFCESGQISKGRLDFFIGGITTQNKAVLLLSASYCVSPASGGFIMVN